MKRLLLVLSVCRGLRAQLAVPSPAALLSIIHDQAAGLTPSEQVDLMYELAIAATGINPEASADWSIEMYDLATKPSHPVDASGRVCAAHSAILQDMKNQADLGY